MVLDVDFGKVQLTARVRKLIDKLHPKHSQVQSTIRLRIVDREGHFACLPAHLQEHDERLLLTVCARGV